MKSMAFVLAFVFLLSLGFAVSTLPQVYDDYGYYDDDYGFSYSCCGGFLLPLGMLGLFALYRARE